MHLCWNSIASPLLGDLRLVVVVKSVDGWFEYINLRVCC